MPNIPNPQSEFLREPNLLIPGKKPVGSVKIDWENPITRGLIGWYIFNEIGSQSIVNIARPGVATGTRGGTTTWHTNANGPILDFGGWNTNAQVDCGTGLNSAITSGSGFSCLFDTYLNSETNHSRHVGVADFSTNNLFVVQRIKSGDYWDCRLSSDGSAWEIARSDADTFEINTWYHFAMTWDGATIRAYTNGVELGSGGGSTFPYSFSGSLYSSSTAPLEISDVGGTYEVDGYNDNVMIFNRGLTEAEVLAFYHDRYHALTPA